jgi:putative FmdB family regulatory protein
MRQSSRIDKRRVVINPKTIPGPEVSMPIYEYLCKKCGEFELMQRITDHPLTRCPTCRGKITKLISNTSFQLKGSGWYITDYARKDGKAKDTATESKSAAESAASNNTKPESKPASGDKKATKEAAAA